MSAHEMDHYVEDHREFFRKAFLTLGFNGVAGDYAEFGCYTGTTFGLAWGEYRKAAKFAWAGCPSSSRASGFGRIASG
ncbi:MAG: hypothetical protein ACRD3M_04145 [Thermoanaerobaculia bacterium]